MNGFKNKSNMQQEYGKFSLRDPQKMGEKLHIHLHECINVCLQETRKWHRYNFFRCQERSWAEPRLEARSLCFLASSKYIRKLQLTVDFFHNLCKNGKFEHTGECLPHSKHPFNMNAYKIKFLISFSSQ